MKTVALFLVAVSIVLFSCEKEETEELKSMSATTEESIQTPADTVKMYIEIKCPKDSFTIVIQRQYQLPGHDMSPVTYKAYVKYLASTIVLLNRDYKLEIIAKNPKSVISIQYCKEDPRRIEASKNYSSQTIFYSKQSIGNLIVSGQFTSENTLFISK